MNTRRRRLQRMRRKHRGWKHIIMPVGYWDVSRERSRLDGQETLIYDKMGIHFFYSRDGRHAPRDQRA